MKVFTVEEVDGKHVVLADSVSLGVAYANYSEAAMMQRRYQVTEELAVGWRKQMKLWGIGDEQT